MTLPCCCERPKERDHRHPLSLFQTGKTQELGDELRVLGGHDSKIKGTLSGFDRVRFRGTLRMLANTKGLSCFQSIMGVLLKDFRQWSMELTERIRRATAELAGIRQRPVIYLYRCQASKEAIALDIASRDGITEGLICVLTCVESCRTFTIRRNAEEKKLELTPIFLTTSRRACSGSKPRSITRVK